MQKKRSSKKRSTKKTRRARTHVAANRSNEQARIRMARFRKRQRIAWNIVTTPKELARLTPRARKAIKAAMGV